MRGGHNSLKYALIGLTPYIFHYDLSKAQNTQFTLLQHAIVFNDVHNFFMPVDSYKALFREGYLTQKLSLENFNVNDPYEVKQFKNPNRITESSNRGLNPWAGKYYPETRDENIKILDDYLTFCEANNIRPVLLNVPVTKKYIAQFNQQLLEEFYVLVEQARQKHPSAFFVDGWKWNGITAYADFLDHEHLNIYGAAKFSAWLNDYLERLET